MKSPWYSRALAWTILGLLLGAPPARAGWQKDQVCQGGCGGGCGPCSGSGGGGGGGGGGGPHWGHATQDTVAIIKRCTNPLCVVFQGGIGFPMAALIDGPYYLVKGVGYGLKEGAIGIGAGAAAVGRGVAYPFKQASAARKRSAAAQAEKEREALAPANCGPSAGESFDAYRGWEDCKKRILARQKALTKSDSANKANELWCKGRVPLASGPNTDAWISRCDPGRTVAVATVAEPAAAPASPAAPTAPQTSEPPLVAPASNGGDAGKAASDKAAAAAAATAAALGAN
ncbi:MAG TPA: hypothetical protein VNI01_12985 [Elusimicrobiota bacterium]|jgi:hypothetical protein|nr:hypothetical protein [Elusimicrobiota bacterium]